MAQIGTFTRDENGIYLFPSGLCGACRPRTQRKIYAPHPPLRIITHSA